MAKWTSNFLRLIFNERVNNRGFWRFRFLGVRFNHDSHNSFSVHHESRTPKMVDQVVPKKTFSPPPPPPHLNIEFKFIYYLNDQMTLPVSCNHVPSHQIEIALIHIAMNVICLQWHLSLGWLRHHRLVVSIVVRRHHQSVLTPINYKSQETTSFKCLNHLKKSKRRWVLYNQQNKLLEGEYLHSGLPVRFLEVQSVSRRKMCK